MRNIKQIIKSFITATKYALIEQSKNRFAFILLIVFLPVWFYLLGALIPGGPVMFKFLLTGKQLTVDANKIGLFSAGLNAITLIIGFMFLASTRKDTAFDKRLILSGYSKLSLLLAKGSVLAIVAAIVALYATILLYLGWHANNLLFVWFSYFLGAMIYGGFGIFLGLLLKGEIEGFFLIIMVSLMDTLLQNPVENPVANKDFLKYFPSFGPTQTGVAAGFTNIIAWKDIGISLLWILGFIVLSFIVFTIKTRVYITHESLQETKTD